MLKQAHGQSRSGKNVELLSRGVKMEKRRLPHGLIRQNVPAWVQVANERGNKLAAWEVGRQLIVQVQAQSIKVDARSRRHAQHRTDLGNRQGSADPVTRRIG